jgi:hypothetical protein
MKIAENQIWRKIVIFIKQSNYNPKENIKMSSE